MCGQRGKVTSVTGAARRVAPLASRRFMIPTLALTLMPLAACTADSPLTVEAGDPTAATAVVNAGEVVDLAVVDLTTTALTVAWTQVGDGTGDPAWYRVKYATPPIDWDLAATGCESTIRGDAVGEPISCVVDGLEPGTAYEVQLMSHRSQGGRWKGAVYSNVAEGRTAAAAPTEEAEDRSAIWISAAEIAALPTAGDAWMNLLSGAQGACGAVDLADRDADTNVCVMAKALVYARTGEATYAADVLGAIGEIVTAPTYDGRALALGRELAAYVIAADLVDLPSLAPELDLSFRDALRDLLSTYTRDGPESLVVCHEIRPNNWGTHCGGSRAAVAAYLGDAAELERVAQVFKGWLGDRSSYAGFSFGDLSWQCDPDRPVGINPPGCTRDGYDVGGVLPDDQRRGGPFTWPAPRENYVWEALQGALVQAVILEQAGYPAFEWEDRALLRAVTWLHDVAEYPAEGDDTWQTHVVNHVYGSSFPVVVPSRAGKNVGWTDWTHGG